MTKQTKTITIEYKVEHNPGNDPHLEAITENYFRGKGCNYKDGILYI